jgi:hypothetical protein
MPRTIRNFWVRTRVDGRATSDESGPPSKDGGFRTTIFYRFDGAIAPVPLEIEGHVRSDGRLVIEVRDDGRVVHRIDSIR